PSLVDGRVNDDQPSERNSMLVRFGIRADSVTMMQDGVSQGGKRLSECATLLARHATSRTTESNVHHQRPMQVSSAISIRWPSQPPTRQRERIPPVPSPHKQGHTLRWSSLAMKMASRLPAKLPPSRC